MSLKILGGLANSRSLFVPKGDLIRPTSIRLKRRLFDSRQDWSGKTFIDLCAGSGAIGIEAWSRGAEGLVLNEANKKVGITLKKNIELLKSEYSDEFIDRPIRSFNMKAEEWLKTYEHDDRLDVVVFLDPPYHLKKVYEKCIGTLRSNSFVGELLIESDRQKGPKQEELEQLVGHAPIKVYEQGTSFIQVFKLN
tara:strand:+ start:31340 stop:31921 length:582 start_codon:yes stop_codon:yes gene_type:complete